jgi:hypothetical protein
MYNIAHILKIIIFVTLMDLITEKIIIDYTDYTSPPLNCRITHEQFAFIDNILNERLQQAANTLLANSLALGIFRKAITPTAAIVKALTMDNLAASAAIVDFVALLITKNKLLNYVSDEIIYEDC